MGFIRRLIKGEKGQSLAVVLALLALGGLVMVPGLDYATSNIEDVRRVNLSMDGFYAADAGVEKVLWSLQHSQTPTVSLGADVNRMSVTMSTVSMGLFTVYFGELVHADTHTDYISVNGSIVWDDIAGKYKVTITVTRLGGSTIIHIAEVGGKLPLGYAYYPGSSGDFGDNMSTSEPDQISYDVTGAQMINWVFGTPRPSVTASDPVATQIFYITGSGPIEDDYAWVVAAREDIGEVGELTGQLYVITSTATKSGATAARIQVDVLMIGSEPNIVACQVFRN